jgi:osmoprotectant transport system permease protein
MTGIFANSADSFIWWSWVDDHQAEIGDRTVEHIVLTAIAVAVGFVVSSILALISVRYRWTYTPITAVGSILYTIPSLALFGLLVPVTGLGMLTAEIALVSYTILILVRTIVTGLDGVPHEVREAADAMGYTHRSRLLLVDLPLALPTIVSGLRIATVTVIGLVTVTALIGNGGYGALIDDGLSRSFSTPIVVGTVLSIALAVVADVAFALVGRALTPWQRRATRRAVAG